MMVLWVMAPLFGGSNLSHNNNRQRKNNLHLNELHGFFSTSDEDNIQIVARCHAILVEPCIHP